MRIYLKEPNGEWKLYEGDDLSPELNARNIRIGADARIGDRAFIGYNASIGDRAFIGYNASIGADARIGDCAFIGYNASIGADARIGAAARIGVDAHILKTEDCLTVGPLGSRSATLTAYRHEGGIRCATGCFLGTLEEFAAAVAREHGDGPHGVAYRHAISYLRAALAPIEPKIPNETQE